MSGLAAGALMAAMLPAVALAVPQGLSYADLDDTDCDVTYGTANYEWESGEALLHVTVNEGWIIATCHHQLTDSELADFGGPYMRAKVFMGFDCGVGYSGEYDEVEATASQAVLTPSGELTIVCRTPLVET